MDFALDADQQSLQEAFGRLFQQHSTPERVRAAEPLGYDPELAKRLWAMGGASMGVPTAAGGGGAGLLELALVCEQLGRHAAPAPLVEVAVTCRLLASIGDTIFLPGAMEGAPLVTLAVNPVGVRAKPAMPERITHTPCGLPARGTGAAGGRGHLVPAGAVADVVIALEGDELVACQSPTAAPALVRNLGSAPMADWGLVGGGGTAPREVDAGAIGAVELSRRVLARGEEAWDAQRRARQEWHVLTAAALVGLGGGALDLAVVYVKERRQFGAPIATFQAVAHRLADCVTALDGARLLALSAADAVDAGDPRAPMLADMAFAFAAETAEHVCGESLHFHGGYGFMVEYDVQLYFRRAKAWALAGGDPRAHYARVADQLTPHSGDGRVADELTHVSDAVPVDDRRTLHAG